MTLKEIEHKIAEDIVKVEHTIEKDFVKIERKAVQEFDTVIKPDFAKVRSEFKKWGKYYIIITSVMIAIVGIGDALIGDFNHFVAEVLPVTVASFMFGYILLKRGDAHVEHTTSEIHRSLSSEIANIHRKLDKVVEQVSKDEQQIQKNKENIQKHHGELDES